MARFHVVLLAFYLSFCCFRNCIYGEFFTHELELENVHGVVKTLFLFFIARFYNRIFFYLQNLKCQNNLKTNMYFHYKWAYD